MIEEGYDLVIRVNPDPDETLVGRTLIHDRLVVVAAPALRRPEGDAVVAAVVRGAGDLSISCDVGEKRARSLVNCRSGMAGPVRASSGGRRNWRSACEHRWIRPGMRQTAGREIPEAHWRRSRFRLWPL